MVWRVLSLTKLATRVSWFQLHRQFTSNQSLAAFPNGLSRSAIYKLTHRKEILHLKPSKRVMFKRSEVDAWIQKSYVPTK
ncbi:helix-turn-helix domain-containing protein [Pseudidiomarina sp.]|uniref:helix-turn-helix domain-containing protein n=1 Tax=Pseudidiomarina sp. TaxID=2081707 RepID=UPI003A970860